MADKNIIVVVLREHDGQEVDVRKNPKSDPSKASKAGRVTHPSFRTVFRNGEILINETFDTIRNRADKN